MTANLLTQEFVFAALEAERDGNKFSINMDEVWQPLGYSRKDSAKRRVLEDLIEGVDYIFHKSVENSKPGRPKDSINLSKEGYKHLGLMAKTPEGRKIREYFMDAEDAYKANLERQLQASLQSSTQDSSKELLELRKRKEAYEKELSTINLIVETVGRFAAISLDCPQECLDKIHNAPYVYEKVMKIINVLIATNPEFSRLSYLLYK